MRRPTLVRGERARHARLPDPMAAPAEQPTPAADADRDAVRRALLLYSGGLDTSVMLRWIQEQYGAEIVALTVNLGQPGEDFDVVVGKARRLGAVDAIL